MLSQEEANRIREKSSKKVQKILKELESNVPGITEGFGAVAGAGIGGATSYITLLYLGVEGVSAAGITSGLSVAGGVVGGGMVAGIGVLAAPVAILGIAGYSIFKHKKVKKQTAALQHAMAELYNIMDKLRKNAEVFKEEIAGIKTLIDSLKQRSPS